MGGRGIPRPLFGPSKIGRAPPPFRRRRAVLFCGCGFRAWAGRANPLL